ncbi:TPM domain-containing protein [Pseudomonas sp. S9]|uniref:TPM domain-containing protein n=1 Tax=Pseudomonas sp. S9 TaxID=686578 RepID=UPI0002557570|nr:TPM domain-containing protein [Pseudomonas sp. S9]
MKPFHHWIQRLFLALMLIVPVLVHAAEVPMLKRHVTDQTGTLTTEQIEQLDQQLVALEKRKGAQMVVLIVSTTAPQDIESYSLAVAEANKIGRKGTDDGLLLLVAKDDRRDRIEVGYGLEGAVPDAAAARIQREFIESRFKQGDFFGGISAGVDALTKLIDGEALPPPTQRSESSGLGAIIALSVFALLMPAIILRMIVGAIIGRRGLIPRMAVGAVLMSLFALFTQGTLAAVLIGAVMGAAFLAIPLGVINIGSGSGRSSGGGFGGGGFSGGSGGGGGFSGGGGSFGGGGSSGSW